jgi:hypothetical protein
MVARAWKRPNYVRVLFLLSIGAVLTALSSWIAAFTLESLKYDAVEFARRDVPLSEFSWAAPPPSFWDNPQAKTLTPRRSISVGVGFLEINQSQGSWDTESLSYDQRIWGIPFPAMRVDWCHVHSFIVTRNVTNDAAFPYRGLEFHGLSQRTMYPSAMPVTSFPLLPWWPGFILNTIFWSLMAAWLARILRFARWGKRLSHGQCPKCKYPIGAKPVCSECGLAVPGGLVQANAAKADAVSGDPSS